jgi:hypothetical protein
MNKPTIQTQNLGGTSRVTSMPGLGGAPTILSDTPITQSADSRASAASAAAGRAQSERASLRADARSRESNVAPKGQVVQTDQGVMLVDPRTGTARPVTAGGEALQPKMKSLPAPIQKALLENDAALRKVDSALTELKAYPEGVGLKNYMGDIVRQRTDPKGVRVRALIADIGSLKIHDRSGAAVTASETPRLKPFIPASTDDDATIEKKLGLFKEEYNQIQDDIAATYTREQGYRAPAPRKPAGKQADIHSQADAILRGK